MNLEAIAQLLETNGVGVQGKTLFIHRMPETVSAGVLILGPLTGTGIDPELPKLRRSSFQVIVRDDDYVSGVALAEQISVVLSIEREQVLGSLRLRWVLPKHEPVVYPVSEGDVLEISVNFEAVYVTA